MPTLLAVALAPVFTVIGLGFLAGRRGWVDNRATAMLGAFVAQFALPISLFLAVAQVPRALLLLELLPAIVYAAALLAGFAAALLVARLLAMPPLTRALFVLTAAMPNFGGIGIGLIHSLEGADTGTVSVAVANLVGTMSVMVWCFMQLEIVAGSGDRRRALRGALVKPMSVLPAIGFAMAGLGLPLPALAEASLRPLAAATGGAGLFLTGVILSTQSLRPTRATLSGAAISNLLQPLTALVTCLALGLDGPPALRAVVAMAIPCGFVGTILSAVYRRGSLEAGGTLVASTLASVVTLPVWIAVAGFVFGI